MKKLKLAVAACVATAAMVGVTALVGCRLKDEPLTGNTLADWQNGAVDAVFTSDGYGNGTVFNVKWNSDNVKYKNGVMRLTISDMPEEEKLTLEDYTAEELAEYEANNTSPMLYEYYGGEARTHEYFGYGDFEVCMKPSDKPGTASTFFTCTGEYDTNPITGQKNPWDEIDIEFLGQDTTRVQFNYYVNGVGGHEYMYDLGFDASEEFHEYGFRWTSEYIVWFVDDVPVYKVKADKNNVMPSAAGRILMNYWCGTTDAEGWMGEFPNPDGDGPEYKWVKVSADPEWDDYPDVTPQPPAGEEGGEGQTAPAAGNEVAVDLSTVVVGGNLDTNYGPYTATVSGDNLNVSYTAVQPETYLNVNLSGLVEAASVNNVFKFAIKNNGTQTVNLRVDIMSTEQVANTLACNLSAKQDGEAASTDTDWGGSKFTIPAGEVSVIEIVYDNTRTQQSVQFMFDSFLTEGTTYSGNLTITDIEFISTLSEGYGDFTHPEIEGTTPPAGEEGGDEQTPPAGEEGGEEQTPPAGEEGGDEQTTPAAGNEVAVDLSTVVVGGNVVANNGPYTATVSGDNLNVSYTAVQPNTYLNVNLSGLVEPASANNVFKFAIKNNGTQTVNLRVDIMSTEQVTTNTKACNLSAKQDGTDVRTDTNYGGSFFQIPAGQIAVIEIVYDNARTQQSVQFMFDSFLTEGTTYSGNLTITDIEFISTLSEGYGDFTHPEIEGTTPPAGEEGGDEQTPPAGESHSVNLTFNSMAGYTVDKSGQSTDSINVKYDGLEWAYCNIGADISSYANGNNTFKVTIKNNADKQSAVRFDIQATTSIPEDAAGGEAKTDACNLSISATGGTGVYTDTQWGGSFITLAAGEEVTVTIVYEPDGPRGAVRNLLIYMDSCSGDVSTASGDLTFSGFEFSNTSAQ